MSSHTNMKTSTSSSRGGGYGGSNSSRDVLIRRASYWKWHAEDLNNVRPKPTRDGEIVANSWLHIRDGVIHEIGSETEQPPPADLVGSVDVLQVEAPADNVLIPGLMDAHIHVAMTGESRYFVDLSGCMSIEELQSAVRDHIAKYPDLTWIIGVAWDQTLLSRYPNRLDLDALSSEKPIFLWRACWHIAVANSKAIELAGISLSSSMEESVGGDYSVEGGIIDVDGDNGLPTGIFRETAVQIVLKALGQKSFDDMRRFIIEGIRYCAKVGLTSVQTNDETAMTVYRSILASNELPIRIFLTPTHADLSRDAKDGGSLGLAPSRCRDYSGPMNRAESRFFVDRIKIFSDSSLGAETAAIRNLSSSRSSDAAADFESASTAPSMKGVLIHKESDLRRMVGEAKERGYRLEIHAIGDAAAEQVISALEYCGVTPSDRPIITHCQILGKDLIDRMRDLGAIANVQPSFVPTDMRWARNRLDPRHIPYSYAWKTLIESGVYVAGGSDSPIESCSPFLGIYDAMMRRGRKDLANETFRPEERLSFSESLWIYTMGASYASMTEHVLGAINKGFAADILFVKSDIFANHSLLATYEPERVMVGGETIYEKVAKVEASGTKDSDSATVFTKLEGNYVPGKNGPLLVKFKWNGRFPYSCKCCTVQDVQNRLLNGEFCVSSSI